MQVYALPNCRPIRINQNIFLLSSGFVFCLVQQCFHVRSLVITLAPDLGIRQRSVIPVRLQCPLRDLQKSANFRVVHPFFSIPTIPAKGFHLSGKMVRNAVLIARRLCLLLLQFPYKANFY